MSIGSIGLVSPKQWSKTLCDIAADQINTGSSVANSAVVGEEVTQTLTFPAPFVSPIEAVVTLSAGLFTAQGAGWVINNRLQGGDRRFTVTFPVPFTGTLRLNADVFQGTSNISAFSLGEPDDVTFNNLGNGIYRAPGYIEWEVTELSAFAYNENSGNGRNRYFLSLIQDEVSTKFQRCYEESLDVVTFADYNPDGTVYTPAGTVAECEEEVRTVEREVLNTYETTVVDVPVSSTLTVTPDGDLVSWTVRNRNASLLAATVQVNGGEVLPLDGREVLSSGNVDEESGVLTDTLIITTGADTIVRVTTLRRQPV